LGSFLRINNRSHFFNALKHQPDNGITKEKGLKAGVLVHDLNTSYPMHVLPTQNALFTGVLLILLEEITLGFVDGVHGLLPLLPESSKQGLAIFASSWIPISLPKKYLRPGSCRSWSATISSNNLGFVFFIAQCFFITVYT